MVVTILFATCDSCEYDSGDVDSIHILKEIVDEQGGNYDENTCPLCKNKTLIK